MDVRPVAGLLALLVLLLACTDQTKVHETELVELLAVLPGHYDNTAQVEADARNHLSTPHDAVALTITKVYTPRLGHHTYYAQESAADDPRRVFSEKMYSFTVDEKRGIVVSCCGRKKMRASSRPTTRRRARMPAVARWCRRRNSAPAC